MHDFRGIGNNYLKLRKEICSQVELKAEEGEECFCKQYVKWKMVNPFGEQSSVEPTRVRLEITAINLGREVMNVFLISTILITIENESSVLYKLLFFKIASVV